MNSSNKSSRRIPQTLRRRALVSCDRCKKRRVRCLRAPDGNPEDDCQSCIASGVKCESTLPRKHRIYGSVETLSLRYRALDALVKGLFPNEPTDRTDTLFRIAEAHDIPMPSNDDESSTSDMLNLFSPGPGPSVYPSPPAESSAHIPATPPSTRRSEKNPFAGRPSKVAEEKLIPAPHGVSHYIGSSSSFGFAFTVRNMVAERQVSPVQHWPDREHTALQSDFGGLQTSKALEPQGPEATAALDEATDPNFSQIPVEQHRQKGRSSQPVSGTATPKRSKQDPLASFLPARDVADALVEAFFQQVHPNYQLFHRGTFQLRYESMWSHYASQRDIEPGWVCSVFMVFVFGAQALEHHDKKQSAFFQRRYLSLVQSRLHHLINTTSLVNIQALLLLQLFQHNASERNASWMLLGCASRMAISLGMHREGAKGGFDPIEKQVRRRVWWTLYMFEQNLCMMLGRPSAIDDVEVTVSLPDETMLDGGDCIPVEYIDYSLRLTKISSRIKRTIYAAPTSRAEQDELPDAGVARQLLLDLESWYSSLPPHLRLESTSLVPKQWRAVCLLHIHYYHTHALATRPFLLRKVRRELTYQLQKEQRFPELDAEGLSLSHACGTSAKHVALLFHQIATRGMLDGVAWLDVYYAYHAVLVLSLDFLPRPREAEDSPDDLARKAAVRNAVDVVYSATLCPTFQVLAQVAAQFSRIVGIFDDTPPAPEGPRAVPPPPPQGDIAGFVSEWFQHDLGFSWDSFDVGGYGGVPHVVPMMPFAPTFGNTLAGVGGEEGFSLEYLMSPGGSLAHWEAATGVFTPGSLTGGDVAPAGT